MTGVLLGPATAARSERLSVEGRLTLGLPLVLVESDAPEGNQEVSTLEPSFLVMVVVSLLCCLFPESAQAAGRGAFPAQGWPAASL